MKTSSTIVALSAVATGFFVKRDGNPMEFMNEAPARVAWNDCGGKGASGSMKIRTLAAKLEGADSMPRGWMRNAGQDCMEVSEDGSTRTPFPGHNGFDPPAVVHNRACAGLDDSECQGDDNCELVGGECTYNQTPHEFDHDHVFPYDRQLYSKTELALGAAEEITRAGIVELNIHGKHAGMEELRAKQHFEDFKEQEAAHHGDATLEDSEKFDEMMKDF